MNSFRISDDANKGPKMPEPRREKKYGTKARSDHASRPGPASVLGPAPFAARARDSTPSTSAFTFHRGRSAQYAMPSSDNYTQTEAPFLSSTLPRGYRALSQPTGPTAQAERPSSQSWLDPMSQHSQTLPDTSGCLPEGNNALAYAAGQPTFLPQRPTTYTGNAKQRRVTSSQTNRAPLTAPGGIAVQSPSTPGSSKGAVTHDPLDSHMRRFLIEARETQQSIENAAKQALHAGEKRQQEQLERLIEIETSASSNLKRHDALSKELEERIGQQLRLATDDVKKALAVALQDFTTSHLVSHFKSLKEGIDEMRRSADDDRRLNMTRHNDLTLSLKGFEAFVRQHSRKVLISHKELLGFERRFRQESEKLRRECSELGVQQQNHRKECEELRQLLAEVRVDLCAIRNREVRPRSPSGPHPQRSTPQSTLLTREDRGTERSRARGPVECSSFPSTCALGDSTMDLELETLPETNADAPVVKAGSRLLPLPEPIQDPSPMTMPCDNEGIETCLSTAEPDAPTIRQRQSSARKSSQRYESGTKRKRRAAAAGKVEEAASSITLQRASSSTTPQAANVVQDGVQINLEPTLDEPHQTESRLASLEERTAVAGGEEEAAASTLKRMPSEIEVLGGLLNQNSDRTADDKPVLHSHGYQLRLRKVRPNYRS